MKTPSPRPLAALLSALLALSPLEAVAVQEGSKPPTGLPVVLPQVGQTTALPQAPLGVPTLPANPDAPAALPAAASAPADKPQMPGLAPLEKAVAPALEAATKPDATPAQAAGAGARLEAAVTGQAPTGVAAELPDVGVPPADIFKSMTKSQKAAFQIRYREHLQRRDGMPDMATQRFSIREKFFADLEAKPVRRPDAPVNQKLFSFQELLRRPDRPLAERMLWALAVAKSNRTERDGVEYGLKRLKPGSRKPDDVMNFIEVEEFYHTRILRDVLAVINIKMDDTLPPHPVTRFMIRSMVHTPKPIANVMILLGEAVGVAIFRLLAEKAAEIFKDQPESSARIQELFQQIMVDEVGHVQFVRSQLGPVRLWLAKRLMPLFTRYFLSELPEMTILFGKKKLMETILSADIDGAAGRYPDRFVPFPAKPAPAR